MVILTAMIPVVSALSAFIVNWLKTKTQKMLEKESAGKSISLEIKEAVAMYCPQAEAKFASGDNLTKLTWVIEQTQKLLGINHTSALKIQQEVEAYLASNKLLSRKS